MNHLSDLENAGLRNIFLACLRGEDKDKSFSAGSFFSKWFRKHGTSYYFLFHKNLSRTNIQFAELVSLVKLHTTNKSTHLNERIIHFLVVNDFIKGMQAVVNDLMKAPIDDKKLCDTFISLYAEVLHNAVLLDLFHGSCSVFFPPHLEINLLKVCSESGYIHSCGKNIYSRELSATDDTEFKLAITTHLLKMPAGAKAFLAVYAHEDFTSHDREFASYLRGGLDDVKVYAEKYYLGKKSLVNVLSELSKEAKDQLFLAEAGDYHDHPKQIEAARCTPGDTLWLIIDRVASGQFGLLAEEQFLICYNQLFKNENPFHIFDENKPAWVAHTTIPHNLAGAMVNITRHLWPDDKVDIYDPFSGTGTIALELMKFESAKVSCNDKSPIAKQLLLDNIEFFGMSENQLKDIADDLGALSTENDEYELSPESHESRPNRYKWALELYDKLQAANPDEQWFDVPADIVDELFKAPFANRLRFYLALRTKQRHHSAFKRNSQSWVKAYRQEVRTLHFQTLELLKLRQLKNQVGGVILTAEGIYSRVCTINPKCFSANLLNTGRILVYNNDATSAPFGMFDVIITDPPYGFNNEVNAIDLASLVSQTLDVLIASLKPNGQLVLALPDRSHSGRKIPVFATRAWVMQQVFAKAEKNGFEAVIPANIMPHYGRLFQPPFYWNSEKALKRAILHFQFRKKDGT